MADAFEKRIKRQVIGRLHRFQAVAPLGFESTLVQELEYYGIASAEIEGFIPPHVAEDGKVEFTAKISEAWKAVAYSRIANRILMEVGCFKAENFNQLEKGVAGIPWELYLDKRWTELVLHVTCKHSRLYHSDAVEERIRNTIECAMGKTAPMVPNGDQEPISLQHLYIRLQDDRCTLWLDLAGEELYKRGHERFVAEAPLKETIAAAMIFKVCKSKVSTNSQWTIVDPMAGSGTFSLEAAYIAQGLIPGKCRDFALKHQPAFKDATWNYILKNSNFATEGNHPSIITGDISQRPIDIIKHNVEKSPLSENIISPQLRDFFSYTAQDFPRDSKDIVLVLNPPYGKRLDYDAPALYKKIGKKLSELASELKKQNRSFHVAILEPKGISIRKSSFGETLSEAEIEEFETSHGGFGLTVLFAHFAR